MQTTVRRPATTYPAIVGGVLAQLRSQQGLLQEELAQALGITQATLSRIENGQSSILFYADQASVSMHSQGIVVVGTRNDDGLRDTLVLIGASELIAIISAAIISAKKIGKSYG
jgi:transcriptional regulator with XRE-family HTH domain